MPDNKDDMAEIMPSRKKKRNANSWEKNKARNSLKKKKKERKKEKLASV